MTVEEFHINIRELLNIGQSQYFPPEVLDSFINNAVLDFFRQEYGHFEATQEISDTLGFYKKVDEIDVTGGVAEEPNDMYYLSEAEAVLSDSTRAPLDIIQDDRWASRKISKGFAPSLLYPVARQIGSKKIEVLPVFIDNSSDPNNNPDVPGVKKIKFYYLRKPAIAKFSYVALPNGTGFQFQANGSINVDYPEVDHPRILTRAVQYAGIPLKDQTSIQAPQIKEATSEGR